jgi:RimJ/RimL family protein N-acetyltransferase
MDGRESRGWLPSRFEHPERVELRCGAHLRPIRAADVEIDYPAVMGSQKRLWEKYGEAWGWPPAHMTFEQDRDDLARHEREIDGHESFNYAILDREESKLLGCVYIDPPEAAPDGDALVSWWVVADCVGTPLEAELDELVPRWVTSAWPFSAPRFHP